MGRAEWVLCARAVSLQENVLRNLADKAFDQPICEALLDQRFFNGIGNLSAGGDLYGQQAGLGPEGGGVSVCSCSPLLRTLSTSCRLRIPHRRPAQFWRPCSSAGR